MRLSRFFLPLLKENPTEASIASHRFMLRAGMIRQLSAGIYNWLPLGFMVLRNIQKIVEEEMNRAGGLQLLMPCIQPSELWLESGRYDGYGKEMLRITDRHDHAMLFGPTNEEVITDIFRNNIRSYKDLPMNLYHIQWKFRDEIRPRFGLMRGREFLMKDAYSFDLDSESAQRSYQIMFATYFRIFKRLGLVAIPVRADTGPIGGNLSHEFHVMADTGESAIYYDSRFNALLQHENVNVEQLQAMYAAADEMHTPEACPIPADQLSTRRGIEVGHVFYFGTKYSKPLKAQVIGKDDKPVDVEMGAYGIGVSRLVAAIIEASHDEHGIIWPESVAPFRVAVLNLRAGDKPCDEVAEKLYQTLSARGTSVLYDDTETSVGVKFSTQDLIGTPWHITVGPKGVSGGTVELKNRKSGEKETLTTEQCLNKLLGN